MKVRARGDHWSKGPFRDRDWTGQTNTVLLGQGADTVMQSMNCASPSCVNLLSVLSMGHDLDAKASLGTCILKAPFTITTF
jgi:hypothetical protein